MGKRYERLFLQRLQFKASAFDPLVGGSNPPPPTNR